MAYQARTAQDLRIFLSEKNYDGVPDYNTAVWEELDGMRSAGLPSPNKPQIDVSDFRSKVKEFIAGLGEMNELSFEGLLDDMNDTHFAILSEYQYSKKNFLFKLEYEQTGTICFFEASILGTTSSNAMDAANTFTISVKPSGQPTLIKGGNLGSLTYDSTLRGASLDGAVTGDVIATLTSPNPTVVKFNSTVTNGSTFTLNSHYKMMNVPDGLTPVLTKTSDNVATLTFTGEAIDTEDVANITLQFQDTAFATTIKANKIAKSTKPDIAIVFA